MPSGQPFAFRKQVRAGLGLGLQVAAPTGKGGGAALRTQGRNGGKAT